MTADNPYVNAGVFVGRARELGRVTRSVRRGQSCLVIGGRRAGKTMLLGQLREADVGRPIFRSDVGGWNLHDEASALRHLGEALGVKVDDREGLLAALDERAPLCLVLDEADRMLREPWSGSLLAWMRWLIDTRLRAEFSLVAAGGPRLLGYEDPNEPGSPAFNISRRELLRPFSSEDVASLAKRSPVPVELEWLCEHGGGHPWLLCQILYELFDGATPDEALREALDQCHDSFPVWLRQLGSGTATQILRSLPEEGLSDAGLRPEQRNALRTARYLCLVREAEVGGALRYFPGPRMFLDWLPESTASESWDLAISYATEDEALARKLKQSLADDFRVFFAPDEEAYLWGEDLSKVLPKIYGVDARYVLVLSTSAYCRKHWTRTEFEAAREREKKLLVVNLGELPSDMPPDVVYREGSLADMVGILDVLRKKLRP